MRHSSDYGYQKKYDDYSGSSSTRTYLALVYNGVTKRPTRLGWIILLSAGLLLWYASQEDSSSGDKNEVDETLDREFNPRFKVMDPAIPNAQLPEFLAVHEKNMAKGAKIEVPIFDPNKHPVPQRVKDEQRRERHDRPRPKDYPVMIISRPDVKAICKGHLDLLLVIDSVAKDVKMRDVIRNTWASRQIPTDRRWAAIFVTGTVANNDQLAEVIRRAEQNATDVLRGHFADSPHEGTRKFMLAMDWVVGELLPSCPTRYVLHTRQRIFHNIPLLLNMIQTSYPDPDEPVYAGKLLRKDVPVRDVNDLNYVPPEDYGEEFFPDIIRKPVYLFTSAAYRRLHDAKRLVVPISMEDAYVGIVAEAAGIAPVHNANFEMMKMSVNNEKCNFIHRYFIYDTSSKDMRRIYAKYTQELKECPH